MDFLTITCHSAFNYGAVLQTYALYTYLTNCGFKGKVIDYRPDYFNKSNNNNILKRIVRPVLRYPDFKAGKKIFGNFIKNNICLTKKVKNIEELKNNLDKADVYITGSDQVWNCSDGEVGNDDAFFLSFVDKSQDKKKISYAASIALTELPDNQKERFKMLLKDFDFLSVREITGVNLIKELGFNNVTQVLDPVYLLAKEDWIKLMNKSKLISKLKKEKYVLVYGFYQQKNVYEYARKLAKNKKCKLFDVNTMIENFMLKTDKYFWNVNPEDFLALVYYSEAVVTNSFHGLSFSLIFNKEFHLFGKKGNSSSRMFDMVKSVDLSDRIVKDDNLIESKIDYQKVNKIMKLKINESEKYLSLAFCDNRES